MKYRHAGEEKGVTSGCTLTPWPCQRRQGRGPALGPKRRRGNKDATLPGPIQSGTASENSNPEAAGEGRTGWTTSLGNSGGGGGVGGGGTHRPLTQQTHPTGPSCLQTGALLPARSALDGMAQGPAQLHSQWGCEALPSGMSREGQSGERGGKPGRSTGGRVEPGRPARHPLKESTAPRGGVGAERKTGAAAELPCLQQREACLLGSGTALRPHRHTHHSVPEAIFCSRLVYQAQSLSRGAEMAEYRRPGLQGAPELQDEPQGDGKMQAPESKQGNRVTRGRPQTHTHICAGTRGPAAGADPTCEPEMLNVQRRGQTAEAPQRRRRDVPAPPGGGRGG